jgi:uncharacterized NAD(P)/FAD-binding protein YdhS
MSAETMGLNANNSLHFVERLQQYHSEDARIRRPHRWIYGEYLQSIFSKAMEAAAKQKISLDVAHSEVVSITRSDDGFAVLDNTDQISMVDKVVLALGNHVACTQSHRIGKSRLESIIRRNRAPFGTILECAEG